MMYQLEYGSYYQLVFLVGQKVIDELLKNGLNSVYPF